jgi:hypothetical protein
MKKYTNKFLSIMIAVVIICFVVMICQIINMIISFV